MRIATYNVEWFNNLFDDDGALLEDNGPSGREGVTRADQLASLGIVFTALDADAVMIVEAPDDNRRRSTVRALENFAHKYGLRARKALLGFRNETQQEIALLFNPDVVDAVHDPGGEQTGKKGSPKGPRFDSVFRWDVDLDANPDLISFSKPPLEARLTTRETGAQLRLIGVHMKSKVPRGDEADEHALTRVAIDNRRKQMAQCIWLRQRVDEHLERGEPLIVLGDFNDGPGLDEFEKLFGRSGVEIVLGANGDRPLYDPHARLALSRRVGAMPVSARFYLSESGRYLQGLLDYIMVSPDLRAKDPVWRIWHPFDDPVCYAVPELRQALLTASDHFPVSIDITL